MKNIVIKSFVFCMVMAQITHFVDAAAPVYFNELTYDADMAASQADVDRQAARKAASFAVKNGIEKADGRPGLRNIPEPVKQTSAAGKKAVMYANNPVEFKKMLKIDFYVNKIIDPAERQHFNEEINRFVDAYFVLIKDKGWINAISDWKDPVKWKYFCTEYGDFWSEYDDDTASDMCAKNISDRIISLHDQL